jgi:uncharacterized protein (TIGR03066 family)
MAILVVGASADEKGEKIDAKKLVGKWQKDAKGQSLMEFTKDGQFRMTTEKGKAVEGTYKVEGDKVKYVVSINGEKVDDVMTVSKLTDTELVVYTFEGQKKPETFTRAK